MIDAEQKIIDYVNTHQLSQGFVGEFEENIDYVKLGGYVSESGKVVYLDNTADMMKKSNQILAAVTAGRVLLSGIGNPVIANALQTQNLNNAILHIVCGMIITRRCEKSSARLLADGVTFPFLPVTSTGQTAD